MTDEKKAPTTLKAGMPPEQNNGLFGGEERIMALGVSGRFTAVVELEVADIVHSEADETRRPVVKLIHVEPLWAAEEIAQAAAARQAANHSRTGADQLNFDGLGDDDKVGDTDEVSPGKKGQF